MTRPGADGRRARRTDAAFAALLFLPLLCGLAMEGSPQRATLFGVECPPCPSSLVTDHGCPGCGLTRSVVLTLDGDPLTGMRVHPAGAVVLLLCTAGALVHATAALRGRRTRRGRRLLRANDLAMAAAVLVGWGVRALS